MNTILLEELENFGLSEKESKIYISLLELDMATVFEVAKHSGINRSSAYVVLEALKRRGLVGISDDKKVRRYIASSPEILLHSAKQVAKKHETIKAGIESIMPQLKALQKGTNNEPIVTVYEGRNGIITAFEDSVQTKEKKVRIVASAGKIMQEFPEYFPNYVQRRLKNKVKMYGIHPDDEAGRYLTKMQNPRFDEPILIPQEKYKMPADMAIYDDKISYVSLEGNGHAVIIQSKEMAEVMKSVFDLAYEEAKRLTKDIKL